MQWATREDQWSKRGSIDVYDVVELKLKECLICKDRDTIGTQNVRILSQRKFDVVRTEMSKLIIDILGISELEWVTSLQSNVNISVDKKIIKEIE